MQTGKEMTRSREKKEEKRPVDRYEFDLNQWINKWMRNVDAVEIWKWHAMFIRNQSKFSAFSVIIKEISCVNPLIQVKLTSICYHLAELSHLDIHLRTRRVKVTLPFIWPFDCVLLFLVVCFLCWCLCGSLISLVMVEKAENLDLSIYIYKEECLFVCLSVLYAFGPCNS